MSTEATVGIGWMALARMAASKIAFVSMEAVVTGTSLSGQ
jgi:hypothetical protein